MATPAVDSAAGHGHKARHMSKFIVELCPQLSDECYKFYSSLNPHFLPCKHSDNNSIAPQTMELCSSLSLVSDRRIVFAVLSVLHSEEMLSHRVSSSVMGASGVCGEVSS